MAEAEASSLLGTLEIYVEIKASAEKFHDMLTRRPHHITKVSPETFQNCELHEGEWGEVGSILFWNYTMDGEAKEVKERVEAIDSEKNMITYRMLEGDLMKEYKSFVVTLQVTPKEDGEGSVAHWHFEYEKINEEVAHPENLIQLTDQVSKEIDVHLLSEE